MRIVRATEKFSAKLNEFMCAAVQRRRDDDGFGGQRGGKWRNAMDLDDSNDGNRLVCVTSGVSYLGRALVKRLLVHGYSVRILIDSEEDKEKVSEMEGDAETVSFNNRITSVVSRLTETESLVKAFEGCVGVFHTSAFVDPAGVSGYSKSMAELEAKVSESVMEACTRTGSVRKCVFTSSLLACTWQNNFNDFGPSIINEECWSDEQFCRDNKLWYALGKLKAEKAAWRISEAKGLKLATICPALITGPDFFHSNSTSTLAYLKGAKDMYTNGLLATIDVNKLAKAHVCLWEGLSDKTAFGRYICFDTILSRNGAEKLAKDIDVQIEKFCDRDVNANANAETETSTPNFLLSDQRLIDLMSTTLRSCYHQS